MNTPRHNKLLAESLKKIPDQFREKILDSYIELKQRYRGAQHNAAWDASGISAGKFCESVLRFLQHALTGKHTPFGTHIKNFPDECRHLVTLPETAGVESLRVIMPRSLVFLYTLRGKRGIGHVGGDIEANAIDAATIVRVCDWVLCELIRVYHALSLEEAQALVDALSQREMPEVWEVGGKKRVLKPGLDYKQKTLLLLYTDPNNGVLAEDLFEWVEHSNFTVFKQRILRELHKSKFAEYDGENDIVYISPLGTKEVEEKLLDKASRS